MTNSILIISKFFYPHESGSEKTTRYIIDYLVKNKNNKIFLFNIIGTNERLNEKAYYYKMPNVFLYKKMQKIKYLKEISDVFFPFIFLFIFLLKHRINIIHIHYAESVGLPAVLLGKLFNIKTVVLWPTSSLYHFKRSENKLSYSINKLYSNLCDLFIIKGMSETQFTKYFKIKKHKYMHSVNPVELKDYETKPLSDKRPKIINILYFGKYNEYRRPEKLIFAIKKLPNNIKKNIKVNMYGKGDYENYIRELNRKYKLENIITINGYANNVKEIMENAHIVVSTTPYEPAYAQALLEAIAAGKIIIVKKSEGIEKFFKNNVLYLLDKMNSKNIANAIIEIINNYEDFVPKANNAKKIVLEKFNFKYFFKQIDISFKRVLYGNKK